MTQIKRTDTFFIISNFNTDPEPYLKYCENYHIYDQSTDPAVRALLEKKYKKISFVQNTGHNLSDYFRFFADNYDSLPSWMMLAKGNMIGRHVTQGYFDRVYGNKYYTFLHDTAAPQDKPWVAYYLYEGAFLEINNSWYIQFRTHKYFSDYNSLLRFVFEDPIIPEWLLFSPGACYIASAAQVRKYPKAFYENLGRLVSYTYFPSEAHQVERLMHLILGANYKMAAHMGDPAAFEKKLEEQAALNAAAQEKAQSPGGRAAALPLRLKNRFNALMRGLMLK